MARKQKRSTKPARAPEGANRKKERLARTKGAQPRQRASNSPKRKKGALPLPTQRPGSQAGSFPIVGIGASAGGLEALTDFLEAMPAESGVAFVLVVHLDPTHVSILPELLQKHTEMDVRLIRDGMKVRPNTVYVIPPNHDISIIDKTLCLLDFDRSRGVHLPIDIFFRSLALDQGGNAVGIVLSGTGSDGTLGIKAIKGEAGMVMVQDAKSAKYDGMPSSAIGTGLADFILPPRKMGKQLIAYVQRLRSAAATGLFPGTGALAQGLPHIFVILRARTGHDFSHYKKNTILRRVERRMNVNQIDDVRTYLQFLQSSEEETRCLFRELLINVTNFFRDPKAFGILAADVLPKLLGKKPEGYSVRVWVPGCSSGEEAYSLAMVLHECAERMHRHLSFQIFGTDIDEEAIEAARAGIYPPSIQGDIGPERLRRYFTKEDDGRFRIKKMIREMLVFATQDVTRDPPFTKLDILCCRNLLIYLNPELQKKIMPLFHYALKPDGVLFLGSSESIGEHTELFSPIERRWKIYAPCAGSGVRPSLHVPTAFRISGKGKPGASEVVRKAEELSVLQVVETILKQSDTPPCAVIDEHSNVLYIHGRVGRFLELPEGRASVNVQEMARPGLRNHLAAALRKVAASRQEVVAQGIDVPVNGKRIAVDLTVKPIMEKHSGRVLMMAVFKEVAPVRKTRRGKASRSAAKGRSRMKRELEEELARTKEDLRTTIEKQETSNEELKSANEELQSLNEELQSTNEELETSKEELQSLNEEAATVNAELQSRIDELSRTNDDMENLLDSTEIAVIFLDAELGVRRFTPKATEIVPLAATDVGRPIGHFATKLTGVDLSKRAAEVLDTLAQTSCDACEENGRCFHMTAKPYRTVNNVIDGVVFVFDDITDRKRSEEEAREARAFSENIVDTMHEALLVLSGEMKVLSANRTFYRIFQVSEEDTLGRLVYALGDGQWDMPELRMLLEQILPERTVLEGYAVEYDFEHIGRRRMLLNARELRRKRDAERLVLLTFEDVTER